MRNCKSLLFILLLVILPRHMARAADSGPWIAMLVSDEEVVYKMQETAFNHAVGFKVRSFNMRGDIRNSSVLRHLIDSSPPSMIVALGAKAAYTAKLFTREHQDIPVLFAMVLNWQRYHLLEDQENITGISTELDPGSQFINLQIFAPNVKKIGVIYSPEHSGIHVAMARKTAGMLGYKLVERAIDSDRQFQRAYRRLAGEVDGLWIPADPEIHTLDNMSWLQERCLKDQLVCLGQSSNLAQEGVLLSVQPDMTNIGIQAASMVENILKRGQRPADIGVMQPLGTRVIVNLDTAERIGLALNQQALNMATEIIK